MHSFNCGGAILCRALGSRAHSHTGLQLRYCDFHTAHVSQVLNPESSIIARSGSTPGRVFRMHHVDTRGTLENSSSYQWFRQMQSSPIRSNIEARALLAAPCWRRFCTSCNWAKMAGVAWPSCICSSVSLAHQPPDDVGLCTASSCSDQHQAVVHAKLQASGNISIQSARTSLP